MAKERGTGGGVKTRKERYADIIGNAFNNVGKSAKKFIQKGAKQIVDANPQAKKFADSGKFTPQNGKARLDEFHQGQEAIRQTGNRKGSGKNGDGVAIQEQPKKNQSGSMKIKSTQKTEKTLKNKAGSGNSSIISETKEKKKFNSTEEMKKRRAAAEAQGKGKFNATEEMKKRRAAAEAAGKGKFNATEEMKKRRAAAEAQGKGKWNAQEEMRKRREAAMSSKKRIKNAMSGKGK